MEHKSQDVFFDEMREVLEDHTKNKGLRRFVTLKDQRRIWNDDQLLRFASFLKLKWDATEFLKKHLLQTLSILVSTSWTDWSRFVEIFIDGGRDSEGNRNRLDNAIPKYTFETLKEADFFGKRSLARKFLEERWVFVPIVIEYGKSLTLSEHYRLPFVTEEEDLIGEGSYGKVTRETIAQYQLKYQDGHPNTDPVTVARKRFEVKKWFLDETRVLETLRRSLSQHDRINTFMATVSIGNEFNIFSELADRNLQQLLEGDLEDFDFTLPNMISESTNLAHALDHLHCHIMVPPGSVLDEGSLSCCHLDLKPENILVYIDDRCPIGKWKISDFGISSVKRAVLYWRSQHSEQVSVHTSSNLRVPSAQDNLKGHLTNRSTGVSVMRGAGTWQAPEVQWSAGTIDGQKADIWSLGCIFMQLLARGLGGVHELQDFDAKRGGPDPNTGDESNTFYRKYGDENRLNHYVEDWIQSLDGRQKPPEVSRLFLQNCQKLLRCMLQISPKARPSAKQVYSSFSIISKEPIDKVLGPRIHQQREIASQPNIVASGATSSPLPTRTDSNAQSLPNIQAHVTPVLNSSRTPTQRRFQDIKGKARADTIPALLVEPQEVAPEHQDESSSSIDPIEYQNHRESPETYDSSRVESLVQESVLRQPLLAGAQNTVISRRQTLHSSHLPTPNLLVTPPDDTKSKWTSVPNRQHQSYRSRNNTIDVPGSSRSISSMAPKTSSMTTRPSSQPIEIPRPIVPTTPPSLQTVSESALQRDSSLSESSNSEDMTSTRPVSLYSDVGSDLDGRKMVISFPIPKALGKTVVQTVISTSCNKIAFIAPTEIRLFLMTNQLNAVILKPEEPGRIWLEASLTENYLLTRAKNPSCDIFSIYKISLRDGNLSANSKRDFHPDPGRLNGVLSEGRFVLFQFPRHVTLKDLKREDAASIKLDVIGSTKKIWFNSSGSMAFVWSAKGRDHYIDAWDVMDTSSHRRYKYRVRDSDNYERPIEDVISFPSKPSCLLWKYRGHICICPLMQHQSGATQQLTQPPPADINTWSLQPLQGIILGSTEDTIFYVRSQSKLLGLSSRIYKCKIYLKGDEERLSIKEAPKGIELELPLEETGMQEERTFCLAVKRSGDGFMGAFQVFIAHCNGKVEIVTL